MSNARRRTVPPPVSKVHEGLAPLMTGGRRLVLAVSGGVDSMVLLHAAAILPRAAEQLMVATFDHGTGTTATRGVALVRRQAAALGLPVRHARGRGLPAHEAAWRAARWDFLRRVAADHAASVCTAHTRDDQLETIVMRLLRDAGVRGLAALAAPSPVLRPFLVRSRAEILGAAAALGVTWIDDPSNEGRAHLRNRVRHDLLPALLAVRPALGDELLALGREAAALRQRADAVVREEIVRRSPGVAEACHHHDVVWPDDGSALYWQSVAAAAGFSLDWRGTERLVAFARSGAVGRRIPLAGGVEAVKRRATIELRRRVAPRGDQVRLSGSTDTQYGMWRFRPLQAATINGERPAAPWVASFPKGETLEVRAWRPGDRIRIAAPGEGGAGNGGRYRRVKRFFSDRRIAAADREGWPVVVVDGEIVWIPGIRRAPAATARPGRPEVFIACERVHG